MTALPSKLREAVAKAIHRKNDLCRRDGPDETWDSGYECACFEMADAAIALIPELEKLAPPSDEIRELLQEIADGRGPYKLDNYEFANSVIENSKANAKKVLEMLAAAPVAKLAYPRPCGLCPGQIESEADLDWHGLGNCVPICERCTGSGIEPAKLDEGAQMDRNPNANISLCPPEFPKPIVQGESRLFTPCVPLAPPLTPGLSERPVCTMCKGSGTMPSHFDTERYADMPASAGEPTPPLSDETANEGREMLHRAKASSEGWKVLNGREIVKLLTILDTVLSYRAYAASHSVRAEVTEDMRQRWDLVTLAFRKGWGAAMSDQSFAEEIAKARQELLGVNALLSSQSKDAPEVKK